MKKNVPFLDLYCQYQLIKKAIDQAIKEIVRNQIFIGGPAVENFEKEVAKFCHTKYAVSLNSGTDALHLALWALGIEKGDEVITTPFSFIATAEVISLLKAKPVFVDINYQTFNINPDLIEGKISRRTKGIIPVHLFGQSVPMNKILEIARKDCLWVVEDACQAIGAEFNGKKVGSLGKVGCFSFYPTKNLGSFGDGGLITTNNKNLAEKIRMLRNHGSVTKYRNEILGVNSRLDSLQAAVLRVKLKHLNRWNKKKQQVAAKYNQYLANIKEIETPRRMPRTKHTYHAYTIRVKEHQRDQLRRYLANNGIATMIYYPLPLHLLKALRFLGYRQGDFPLAEQASQEVLSLPIYPEIPDEHIEFVANKIAKFFKTP